jgi:Myb-like DNA-binding domain
LFPSSSPPSSFRTYFPDAYKQHYPNAKTHLSSKVRSALPDGTSIFEKTRSKKRRPFTEEEDRALKAGYDKHGTVWATIVKDPIFQEQNRRSTDLRDRFRNAFPDLYQAAGYKPRNSAKKRLSAASRAVTDEHLHASRETGPARRKRRYTTQGFLRGGTKSVPLSPNGSEEEESSGDDDDDEYVPKYTAKRSSHPEPMRHMISDMRQQQSLEPFREAGIPSDSLAISDILPSASQSDVTDSSHSQTWSAIDTPMHSTATWSTGNTAASPASSSQDFFFDSPFTRRGLGPNGMTMVGKSAWGPTDWLSANPRLDQSTANSSSPSYFGCVSPSPNSPFALNHLSHGVLDRYDLFPPSLAHDFASEAGPEHDGLSAFSDPEMMPSSAFHGMTHHSNYAGDLIFGSRTHQPPVSVDYGPGFGFGAAGSAAGLGLALHPLQMHTPALPGIDEIELAAINLNDGEPDVDLDTPMDAVERKPSCQPRPRLPQGQAQNGFGVVPEEILDLDVQQSAPGTPVRTEHMPSQQQQHHHQQQQHLQQSRSLSVPPPEHRFLPHALAPPLTPSRSLSLDLAGLSGGNGSSGTEHALMIPHGLGDAGDAFALPFLDLHYFQNNSSGGAGNGGGVSSLAGTTGTAVHADARQGLALDLACVSSAVPTKVVGSTGDCNAPMPRERMHHRGMSAVSPQDLVLNKGSCGDNKRKRASWDGGSR